MYHFVGVRRSINVQIELTSTLFDGDTAYEGQEVSFICFTKNNAQYNFLTWCSDDYLDQPLQISIHDDPGQPHFNYQNPSTVATLVNFTTNGGVTMMVSQLWIIASTRNSTSSVGCQIDSDGQMNTITFRKDLPCILTYKSGLLFPSWLSKLASKQDYIIIINGNGIHLCNAALASAHTMLCWPFICMHAEKDNFLA